MTLSPAPPSIADPPSGAETPILPAHIELTIASISRLHERHQRGATSLQRGVEAATAVFGRARFAGLLAVILVLWMGANLILPLLGRPAFDPPPFNALQGVTQFLAVFLTVFILATQRRENELSELRQQLTLELALLSEQKSAKLIALVEELRVDMPSVPNRTDLEAEAYASPADPEAVLEALRETTAPERAPSDDPDAGEPLLAGA
jgi:uncharacterized membrane protein